MKLFIYFNESTIKSIYESSSLIFLTLLHCQLDKEIVETLKNLKKAKNQAIFYYS